MKNLILSFFVLLGMLAGTSCKKDKPLTLEQKILGKWTWTQFSDTHIPAELGDIVYDMPGGSYMEFLGANLPNNHIFFDGFSLTEVNWVPVDDTSFISEINGGLQLTLQNATPTSMVLTNSTSSNGVQHIVSFTLTKP